MNCLSLNVQVLVAINAFSIAHPKKCRHLSFLRIIVIHIFIPINNYGIYIFKIYLYHHKNFTPLLGKPSFYSFALLLSIIPLIKFFNFYAYPFSILYIFSYTLFLPEFALFLQNKSLFPTSKPKCDLKSNLSSLYLSILSKLAMGSEITTDLSKSLEFFTTSGWKGSMDSNFFKYLSFFISLFLSFSYFSSFLIFLLTSSSSLICSSNLPYWGFILN